VYLGLHLGHDSSASLFDKNGLVGTVIQERLTGIRHDYGLKIQTIDSLLSNYGVAIEEIESVGITCTQLMPALIQSPSEVKLQTKKLNTRSDNLIRVHGLDWFDGEMGLILDEFNQNNSAERWNHFIDEDLIRIRRQPKDSLVEYQFYTIADPLWLPQDFSKMGKSIQEVISTTKSNFSSNNTVSAQKMCDPIEIEIRGHAVSGYFWSHHAAHAASNASMGIAERIILTHDGGIGAQSGGIWNFDRSGLNLLSLHELELGQMYDYFANRLGLGIVGGAGKLMGLAAYGDGSLFQDSPYFGTPTDMQGQVLSRTRESISVSELYEFLFELCVNESQELGWDISAIGDPARVTEIAPAEIANFIQRLVEKSFSILAEGIQSLSPSNTLGVSGGFALNCPTNSKLLDSSKFSEVIIDPHCEDGGCSVGAAFLSFYKQEGKFPEINRSRTKVSRYAYKGLRTPAKVEKIAARSLSENAVKIANLIVENKVVGIFYLNSEVGPRALGHRSIIANVTFKENWNRVNLIKGRELWRPFAPATVAWAGIEPAT
jgi:carbamoyltransferase